MAVVNWRHLTSANVSAVAQSKTFTVTGTGGGTAVWTFTLTDDNGDTHTVTYTEDGSPSVTEVATGLFGAWNASSNPHLQRITATNPSAGVVVLTSDTAGIPFSVALADDGSGTHTEADTTASVGLNDYGTAANWTSNAVPIAVYDDVTFEAGAVGAIYGLNQSAVAIPSFTVEEGCTSQIGRFEFGQYKYLRIDPDAFTYRGQGRLCLFDLGSAAIAPTIFSTGEPNTQGLPALFLKGSALSTVEILRGHVGLAYLDGDTATVATLTVGNQGAAAGAFGGQTVLYLGSGLTLTTLNLSGGTCNAECAMTTATVSPNGILKTSGAGAITTCNLFGQGVFNSTGTVGTLNCHGLADFTQDRTARTISTLVEFDGGEILYHSGITISARTALASSGNFRYVLVD